MGIIADTVAAGALNVPPPPIANKFARLLAELDDADHAIVMSWVSELSDEDVEERLHAVGLHCSDTTIRKWRRQQRRAAD